MTREQRNRLAVLDAKTDRTDAENAERVALQREAETEVHV